MRARSVLVVLLFCCACGGPARADLTADTAVLVVNGDSPAAVTVANHYIALRDLPPARVVVLRDLPDWRTIGLNDFRDRVLRPTLEAVDARGLAPRTDLILYTPAVPTAINMGPAVRALDPKPNKVFTPVGSLTGLTQLYQPVLAGATAAVLSPRSNGYFAGGDEPATVGFRSSLMYGADGAALEPGVAGRRFLLSAALGVTTGPGETVGEVTDRLAATVAADAADPAGAVLFTNTKDVRVTARRRRFGAAAAAANAAAEEHGLAVFAAVAPGALPRGRDLAGLTSGAARANWRAAGSRFSQGAFADNLTSFGGVVHKPTSQTTAVDWLRWGGSAAGGTVTEPYAVPFKFPDPHVHAHRLRGATLAEAVGLSVAGPYQYLLLGDGLSNPWANRPAVAIDPPAGPVRGVVALTPTATVPAGDEEAGWEAFTGGVPVAAAGPGEALRWDTRGVPDGVHRVSVVATLAGPAGGKGRAVAAVRVRNAGRTVAARLDGAGPVAWGEDVRVRVAAEGFDGAAGPVRAELRHHGELVAAADLPAVGGGYAGVLTVGTRPLGWGPVTLAPRVTGAGETAVGAGVRVDVREPPPRPGSLPAGVRTEPGPRLTVAGESRVLTGGLPRGWLKAAGVPAGERFALTAAVRVTAPGPYRLAVRSNCGVIVSVGGKRLPWFREPTAAASRGRAWRAAAAGLDAGWHEVTLTGTAPAKGAPVCSVLFGRRGQREPTAEAWRHRD